MSVAATKAGRTPATMGSTDVNAGSKMLSWKPDLPVDLYNAPLSPPAAILPYTSCFPRHASMEELRPLYTSAEQDQVSREQKESRDISVPTYLIRQPSFQ